MPCAGAAGTAGAAAGAPLLYTGAAGFAGLALGVRARAAGTSGSASVTLAGLEGSAEAGAAGSCSGSGGCAGSAGDATMARSNATSGCGIGPTAGATASQLATPGGGSAAEGSAGEVPTGGGIAGGALSEQGSLLHARSAANAMTLWRLVGLSGGPAELGRCCSEEGGAKGRQLHTGISSLGMRLGRDLDTHRLQRSCTAVSD